MEKFKQALDDAINSWAKLSQEWEKNEDVLADVITEGYPFNKDFNEVLLDLINWRDQFLENQK
ncbi:conserved hypothetical protein [Paenibacillus curdlanolyticus YK9]|uniref:Uncharacterized protein n=1 Tax=Paenibacillus curdlanolyticus YK9 TaxID=717606 RepID=E0ID70_9BACL|nr:hypothetical protein [Paenibacillus curdlanolyticus]EFM09525.1 conserved hypothetical protein [Paenibacillus curdlanolyticus YK9]